MSAAVRTLAAQPAAAARGSRCRRSYEPCRGTREGLRILIVDPRDGLEAVHYLSERGHVARAIADIPAAVHMGESFRPHVCIVNLATCHRACESVWQLRTALWGRRCVLIAAQARDAREQYLALEAGFSRTVPGPLAVSGWLARLTLGSLSA